MHGHGYLLDATFLMQPLFVMQGRQAQQSRRLAYPLPLGGPWCLLPTCPACLWLAPQ